MWNNETRDTLNYNFKELNGIPLRMMEDFLNADPSRLNPSINGVERSKRVDATNLNDFGVNFTAESNGIIHRAWVFSNEAANVALGLAEQKVNEVATSINGIIEAPLEPGWNNVELKFPVEQNKSYTLFKRNIDVGVDLGRTSIDSWSNYQFQDGGLSFNGGKFLNENNSYKSYMPFYDIQFVTNPSQVYKIANSSVVPPKQFYVGDNPPLDSQFWFKPKS